MENDCERCWRFASHRWSDQWSPITRLTNCDRDVTFILIISVLTSSRPRSVR
jgi:hypothetical protein